ncbi:hypothetical protein KAFR_0E02690 [Kazachstania africana CBS 2517]|uniref:Cytochrome c oxidase assembly protein COX20, mitochondrial n=1 Tax=Kazachstania africana (strain ATCC 22294 / BCRC 22015 / CBS 2517 / CECT 1963 / NBRC 1671 / NRRL Y-8276) TaxID=1071382 RepID=H2AVM1_KAZAF|nr:hypothetical protein KAFR_0E02690 [Kazachstania africana CBS 2517]CCF58421.1 hypothetical protein KAFR_0E02690 [Kazachstania africana CBS 2517]
MQDTGSSDSAVNYSQGQKILLRDTSPRFEDTTTTGTNDAKAELKQAVNSISLADFKLVNLATIPCFRNAGMIGFSSMLIFGSITFLYNRNITKATNWSAMGLILGSIVGWEQCRLKRQNDKEFTQLAIQTVAKKPKPMLHKDEKSIENLRRIEALKKDWDKHPNDISNDTKPWYKVW